MKEDSGQEGLPLPELAPDERVRNLVETLLFAADEPLPATRMAEVAEDRPERIRAAIDELNVIYEDNGRTFRIHRVARGYQMYTLPEFAGWVRTLYRRHNVQRLSRPSLEVLAIVAYKQPVTRPEVEQLRGVDCSGPLVTLLERRLIATAGKAKRPGSPFLYRTTREFLRYFGLVSLDDLPPMEELSAFLAGAMEGEEREVHEHLAIGDPSGPAEPTAKFEPEPEESGAEGAPQEELAPEQEPGLAPPEPSSPDG